MFNIPFYILLAACVISSPPGKYKYEKSITDDLAIIYAIENFDV